MTTFKDSKADVLNPRLNMFNQPVILANLTTTERDALTTVVDGMVILNITLNKVQARVNSAWVDLN